MVLGRRQLSASLHEEKYVIQDGRPKEDSPLDTSEKFINLCEACRKGDLKSCQELISMDGININARDEFDYTPLISASLCGHYEVVELLLESGALCDRDTFQGERCLYNALNDRIRNLLLSYDYSKTANPLQPWASHMNSLLTRKNPQTSDILVASVDRLFNLHKFVLAARSPYFAKKLGHASSWELPVTIPVPSFEIAIKYIYLGEIPNDIGGGPGTGYTEEEILEGIERISKRLEIQSVWDRILETDNSQPVRRHRTHELEEGRIQFEAWFRDSVLQHKSVVDSTTADDVKWDRNNSIFADVLLRADEIGENETWPRSGTATPVHGKQGSMASQSSVPSASSSFSFSRKSTIFPAHRAILIRSPYFEKMFSSSFIEAKRAPHLLISLVDCTPDVLEIVLTYLYTEKVDIPHDLAVDVLFAADLLFIDKLKARAAVAICTLGNDYLVNSLTHKSNLELQFFPSASGLHNEFLDEPFDIFEVLRAAWLLHVPRLEEFVARYFAFRLEWYIADPEFAELVKESASRIKVRQETDSIELIDDIRYFLSERSRLRFEDTGMEELMDEAACGGTAPELSELMQVKVVEMVHPHAISMADDEVAIAGVSSGVVRALDGQVADDEFICDAINYQLLLGKIDALLERMNLEA